MSDTHSPTASPGYRAVASASDAPTRALLVAGMLAGPLWIAIAGLQIPARDGFDLTRHPVSVLSNGDLGWVQIASFVITGLLFLAAGAGVRQQLISGRGATWIPRLLALVGVGMLGSGIFVADPLDGFPPGTPPGLPNEISWHGALHFLFAAISLVSLSAAAFVVAARFAGAGARGFAGYSVISGGILLVAWLALLAAPTADAANVALAIAVSAALIWTSVLCAKVARPERPGLKESERIGSA